MHTTNNDGGIQGLNGRIFEGKNGNTLFIPAAGYYNGYDNYDIGSNCCLYSSSLKLDDPSRACRLSFNSVIIHIGSHYRHLGYSIRPVINL